MAPHLKKTFITGVILLLPFILTLMLVSFLFNLLTTPFVGVVSSFFNHYELFQKGFFLFNEAQITIFFSRVMILLLLVLFTIGVGFIGRYVFVNSLIHFWEGVLYKIPFVRSIYKMCKDVMNTVMATETRSFKQVVLVPFPSVLSQVVGLVTQENIPSHVGEEMMAVFVPTTPNPTSGFLMLYKKSDVTPLDMPIEEAFKYIISCGVILSSINVVDKGKNG
jgi:uncharacterized membrane protein